MDSMDYIERVIEKEMLREIQRGKSILLLGPRQTGKTTLLNRLSKDLFVTFLLPGVRQKYEREPESFVREVLALLESKKKLLIVLDEIQKVPQIFDSIQWLVDEKKVQFVLSGSSSRKLRKDPTQNLLPGRVVHFHLDPLNLNEFKIKDLEDELLYGSLPGIKLLKSNQDKEKDLISYVEIYLEEEIRNEAVVRNLPAFGKFLELAAEESGQIINLRNISREIGIAHSTVADYYQILEDTLIAERIEPFTKGSTRKKLTKSPRYLFFDLGVARVASHQPPVLTNEARGKAFESYVGLQILRMLRNKIPRMNLSFWRDPDGPEVDWIVNKGNEIIPIEVKYTKKPEKKHFHHLQTFLSEYPQAKKAYVVCLIDKIQKWDRDCYAIPHSDIGEILE